LADVSEVAAGVFMIDERLYSLPQWGSAFLVNEAKKALIDSGPATSAAVVLEGIRQAGVRPEDIDYIIITHIHLDHCGGAGELLKYMPRAKVMVHRRGARHLADPARLVKSTREAQGEDGLARVGNMVPIPAERIIEVGDGERLALSNRQTLEFMETPGHAPHEICIFESRNKGVFSGDAVSLHRADGAVFLPYHPPPAFDLADALDTLDRLAKLDADKLYYSHYGVGRDAARELQAAREKLLGWHEIARRAAAEGDLDGLAERFIAQAKTELGPLKSTPALYDYVADIDLALVAAGHVKYYRDKGFSQLEAK